MPQHTLLYKPGDGSQISAGSTAVLVPLLGSKTNGARQDAAERLIESILTLKGFDDESMLNSAKKGKRALIIEAAKIAAEYLKDRHRYNEEPELLHSLRMTEELAKFKARTWLIVATMLHSLRQQPEGLVHLEKKMAPGWFQPLERAVLLVNKPYVLKGSWIEPCTVVDEGGRRDYVKNERYFSMLLRMTDSDEVERNEKHAEMLLRAWNDGIYAPLIIKFMNSYDNLKELDDTPPEKQREIIMEALPYVQMARVLNWEFFVMLRRFITDHRHLLEGDEKGRAALCSLNDRSYEEFMEDGCIVLPPRNEVKLGKLPDANCPLPIIFCKQGKAVKEIEFKAAYVGGAENGDKTTNLMSELAKSLEPVIGDSSERLTRVDSMLLIPGWGSEFIIFSVFDRGNDLSEYKKALKGIFEKHFKAAYLKGHGD